MANMGSFIWYTIVVVGILVSSLAMISMGAACWEQADGRDNCLTVKIVAQYLVVTGSVFFFILVLLLLLTFCICTSSGDPKISGPLRTVYIVSVVVMYLLIIAGSTLLFVEPSVSQDACNKTITTWDREYERVFNSTPPPSTDTFCTKTPHIFSYSVLGILHALLFFSLLVNFCVRTSGSSRSIT